MGDFHDNYFSPNGPNRSSQSPSSSAYQEPPQVRQSSADRSMEKSYKDLRIPDRSRYQVSDNHAHPSPDLQPTSRTDVSRPQRSSTNFEPRSASAHPENAAVEAGKDRWHPSSDSRWKRVQGEVYAGESQREGGPATRKVPATSTAGSPVYQTNSYGSKTVYGYRANDGVASFSDRKPPMQQEPPKSSSQYGDKE